MGFKGTLFLVVGPSGVGKDTLLEGARAALVELDSFRFCQRVVTRAPEAGGEDYLSVTEDRFLHMQKAGAFFHSWSAHGLSYGIPASVRDDLENGKNVVVNVSRRELARIAALWPTAVTISIEASPEVITHRLKERGRESASEIAERIAHQPAIPEGAPPVIRVTNDTTLEAGIHALVQAIVGASAQRFKAHDSGFATKGHSLCAISAAHPVTAILRAQGNRIELVTANGQSRVAELLLDHAGHLSPEDCALDRALAQSLNIAENPVLELHPAPSPDSRSILRKKIRGEELAADEIESVVEDMVAGRYSQAELAGFLVSASHTLSAPEVVSLTRARARWTENIHWPQPLVVDKHSMGGIPGNCITPIVVPLVTAAGLMMPKTSSRAITSASGTADAMEVMAKVDLTPDEVRAAVSRTGGCIAWNGRLTQSPVDDVMNAINRPLGLRSARLDVSSILSKKLAAGSSHVLVDMPVGPEAKTHDMAEAAILEELYVSVGMAVGLQVRVKKVDGTRPVGRGVGPALEMRDVMMVLDNDPSAPDDLRTKALDYTATILEWAGAAAPGTGLSRAQDLLISGEGRRQFDAIVDAQGRQRDSVPAPAPMMREITAHAEGILQGFSVREISAIARAAGAPQVQTAGVDLLIGSGERFVPGQPLLRIHAATGFALSAASDLAQKAQRERHLLRRAAEPAPLSVTSSADD